MLEQEQKTRLDKWLWAARFYKTRALATEAISGGHVHLNGQRVKPSRPVQVGDELTINKTPYTFDIVVQAMSSRRGSATQAQQLYQETETSKQRREQLAEERKVLNAAMPAPQKRPDKRDRRRIIQFRDRQQKG